MPQFNRRVFLAGSALAAAPLSAVPGTSAKRNLLTSAWTASRIASVLLPRERFHPYPPSADRAAWGSLPADVRSTLVASGEQQLATPWEVLSGTLFLEYKRNGNRSRFEAVRDRRRKKLQDLVIAECVDGKGRFGDEIANGVWLICEESFWGVPAHLGAQRAGTGLPDVSEPIVDLFAAETANLLSWTLYLARPQLASVSKLIPERIRLETERRVLEPCLTRDDFGWMGFSGRPVNNWNPWICSNWLTAALIQETDEKRRHAHVLKILRCLDHFLNGYEEDGGCDEGPSYWGRAGASLFDCLDLLYEASSRQLDAFPQPLVREIGRYICRAHIAGDWYTNFADAAARISINGDLVYRYGKRAGDERMMAHGAYAAFLRNPAGIPGDSIGRQLPALFNLEALRKASRAQALFRDAWLPGIQVMAARCKENSVKGLYLAAQGGHNAESHNHNDVGNFVVYSNGLPAIIDVGVETYTAKTFSSRRYEIWTMQSAFHNCPTIDTVMQSAGREFAARDVAYKANDSVAEFQLDLAAAYPKDAHLQTWKRILQLDRAKNEIQVLDNYTLSQAAKTITLTLMTSCRVTQESPGCLSLAVADGTTVNVLYDGRTFQSAIEEIHVDDARLRSSWGDRIYRILLRAESPPLHAEWIMRLSG